MFDGRCSLMSGRIPLKSLNIQVAAPVSAYRRDLAARR
jgi:hypothetical protein